MMWNWWLLTLVLSNHLFQRGKVLLHYSSLMKRKEEFHHSRSLKSLWCLCSHHHHQKSFSSTYLLPSDNTGTNGIPSNRSNVSLVPIWLIWAFTSQSRILNDALASVANYWLLLGHISCRLVTGSNWTMLPIHNDLEKSTNPTLLSR